MKRYTLNESDLHQALRKAIITPTIGNPATTDLKWSVVRGKLTVSLFEHEKPPEPEKAA